MSERDRTKKGPEAAATARGPIPAPGYEEKDATMFADRRRVASW